MTPLHASQHTGSVGADAACCHVAGVAAAASQNTTEDAEAIVEAVAGMPATSEPVTKKDISKVCTTFLAAHVRTRPPGLRRALIARRPDCLPCMRAAEGG